MSTKISDIYDTLVDRLEAVLPSHNRLSNPYIPEQNPEPTLKQAWGLQYAAGANTNRQVNCHLSLEDQFVVVLTRKYYALELDADSKSNTEKDLLEDRFLVIQDFEKDPSLLENAAKAVYVSNSGIQFVFNQDKPFYKLEMTFSVEYFEQL